MLYCKITAFSTYHYHTLIGISNWHISPSFYFIFVYSVQLTVNKCNLEKLPMAGFKLGSCAAYCCGNILLYETSVFAFKMADRYGNHR